MIRNAGTVFIDINDKLKRLGALAKLHYYNISGKCSHNLSALIFLMCIFIFFFCKVIGIFELAVTI